MGYMIDEYNAARSDDGLSHDPLAPIEPQKKQPITNHDVTPPSDQSAVPYALAGIMTAIFLGYCAIFQSDRLGWGFIVVGLPIYLLPVILLIMNIRAFTQVDPQSVTRTASALLAFYVIAVFIYGAFWPMTLLLTIPLAMYSNYLRKGY